MEYKRTSVKKSVSMSYVKILIHCVWGTKNRQALITKEIKWDILNHIKENAKTKGIFIDCINAVEEHIHCIISLSSEQMLSKVIQLIKGESSFWINKNNVTKSKFEWTDEYYAVSVSESQLSIVRKYIKNQEEHHKKKTWSEECEEFLKKYNFKKNQG